MSSNYATADNLRDHKIAGVALAFAGHTDDELDVELELADFIIEAYTCSIFYLRSAETQYLDGTGNRVLFTYPTTNYPLITATSVLEVDESDATLWTFTAVTDYFTRSHSLHKVWADRSSARRAASRSGGHVWPVGIRNIKVTGNWGLAAVPLAVQRSTILLAAELIQPGSTKLAGSAGVREQEWDDYRIQYQKSSEDQTPVSTTGLDFVDRLLDSYRIQPSMFQVPATHAPN